MSDYPSLHMIIDGEKVSGGGRRTFDVVNPVTGETLAELPLADAADLEVRRGRLDQAFAYANESLQYAEQSNNLYMKTRTYRHLAKAYMAQKDNVTAEEYLKMSLNCGREMGDKAEIVETMSALFDFYRSVV